MIAMHRFRGVNLGNWLVLERWMKPELFLGTDAEDVYGLEREVAPEVLTERLRQHYDTYVTADTFSELAEAGVDLARIPVPYWTFGSAHHEPVYPWLDRALAWAEESDISVLLDLHTVPGSQNGFDNGGVCGLCTWHLDPARIDFTVGVVRRLAERYGASPALFGIEPLNEPVSERVFRYSVARRYGGAYPERITRSAPCPRPVLRTYYQRAYEAVRRAAGERVALVLHDRFELGRWDHFMEAGSAYVNVWLDTHRYVCFDEGGMRVTDLRHYLRRIRRYGREIERASRHHPVLVGEWSLGNHLKELTGASASERDEVLRALAQAQLAAWDKGRGGCFWSFANDAAGREVWSLRESMGHGWLSYADGGGA